MTVEAETGFHFRRRDDSLVLAMTEATARWGFEESVDEALAADWLQRLRRRFPPAAEARIESAWAGLYDMTPDAHPIVGFVADGVYAACGFSGHGFMQSPAVGAAAAAEILGASPPLDLSPYRLDRFAAGAVFPERVVL
jgi:sarcosine oxidase subunit beta